MKVILTYLLIVFSVRGYCQTDLEEWFSNNIYGNTFIEGIFLQTVTNFSDPQDIKINLSQEDRVCIVINHNYVYSISPDTLLASGCSGPTCGTNGVEYYITALEGDTVVFIAYNAGIAQLCASNAISESNEIIVYSSSGEACVKQQSSLPITWFTLSSKKYKNSHFLLSWSTSSESNNACFDIEHRSDRSEFETIGKVEGNGTTTVEHNYQFIHEHPVPGNNYYRLKQVDFDGSYTYSPVVHVDYQKENEPLFSNPVQNALMIHGLDSESEYQVTVYTSSGKKCLHQIGSSLIDVSHLLPGLYILQLDSAEGTIIRRMIKI